MAKRYYLCPIVGGTSWNDPYRPLLSGQPGVTGTVSVIENDPATGKPLFDWCLCLVASQNHALLRGLPGVDPLPDFPLDGKVSAINNATRSQMLTRLQARGLDTSFVQNADGYREVVRGIGRHLSPNFDENAFDVADQ
ncbi:MAG TPA: hypothetical protein VFU47_12720 [Armatimonadota bacterium]|nr:hypothetical protein [Armatimonadota bacterium]